MESIFKKYVVVQLFEVLPSPNKKITTINNGQTDDLVILQEITTTVVRKHYAVTQQYIATISLHHNLNVVKHVGIRKLLF